VGDGVGVGVGVAVGVGVLGEGEAGAGEDERVGAGLADQAGAAVGAGLVRADLVGVGATDEDGIVGAGLGGAIAAASGRPARCCGEMLATRVSESPAIANAASTRTPPAMARCCRDACLIRPGASRIKRDTSPIQRSPSTAGPVGTAVAPTADR
jgi:hypothetical protein